MTKMMKKNNTEQTTTATIIDEIDRIGILLTVLRERERETWNGNFNVIDVNVNVYWSIINNKNLKRML